MVKFFKALVEDANASAFRPFTHLFVYPSKALGDVVDCVHGLEIRPIPVSEIDVVTFVVVDELALFSAPVGDRNFVFVRQR